MSPKNIHRSPKILRLCFSVLIVSLLNLAGAEPLKAAQWPQWGGADRNFRIEGVNLVPWPEEGPKVLWNQPLGLGFSAIAVQDERLYTLYREQGDEVVASFDAANGSRFWSHRYRVEPPSEMRLSYGSGPHATPLVVDGKVFTVGTTGRLWALEAASGRPLWNHDLWQEFGGDLLRRGYASSPIAHGDNVIVTVGGEGGLMAFAQDDGQVVWSRHSFFNSQSSPILIEVEGQEQLVAFVKDEILAVDPQDGELLWRHPHASTAAYNISTPVWTAHDQTLFFSSAYGGGSRLLKISRQEERSQVEELWSTKKLRVHYTNSMRLGDYIYASHGNNGAIFSLALDAKTGEMVWRDRAVKRANFLVVGEQVLVLESEGRLLLTQFSPEKLEILSEFELFSGSSMTVPSLVGRRLFARNEERLIALELPVAEEDPS